MNNEIAAMEVFNQKIKLLENKYSVKLSESDTDMLRKYSNYGLVRPQYQMPRGSSKSPIFHMRRFDLCSKYNQVNVFFN
ncbi:hypothetical protein [Paenibacillus xylanexedens]|uniref:hypothetical protein n=1 Tax=Paenibacillus xylanexedens TaxID=528191 RepID=UPI00119EC107|nr:hypothetical protein [Paenibacillus xylanexedens]